MDSLSLRLFLERALCQHDNVPTSHRTGLQMVTRGMLISRVTLKIVKGWHYFVKVCLRKDPRDVWMMQQWTLMVYSHCDLHEAKMRHVTLN